jgi:hypothetical protein
MASSTQQRAGTGMPHFEANRLALYGRKEVEVCFSNDSETVCCGQVLKPFWAYDGRMISLCSRCGLKYTDNSKIRYKSAPWIGVDLDGTLAHDVGGSRGSRSLEEIGSPIKPMVDRLRNWIAEGKTVKIFTARASSPHQVVKVKKWLAEHGLPDLEVTNVKDLRMIELWDDRCVQVMTNSGQPVRSGGSCPENGLRARRSTSRRISPSGFFSRLRIFLTL